MVKHILFITTHNLATNPRLVKEIRLALQHGYKVTVIAFVFNNWSKPLNDQLIKELNYVKWIWIAANKKPLLPWSYSVACEKWSRLAVRLGFSSVRLLANAVSRRNVLLLRAIKKVKQADWVIGHNPGALYATFVAARQLNARAGFDVEDYHPGEDNDAALQQMIKQLMQQVLPHMQYVSFAAPLIMEQTQKDITTDTQNWFTVNNFFSAEEFSSPVNNDNGPLKLVWFSQNISTGRGLEHFIPVIKNNAHLQLHLYGNCDEAFKQKWLTDCTNIILHGTLPQRQLHRELAQYDIGLAIEISVDRNRALCLTNKIMAYFQAGLYILATDTPAQQLFLKQNAGHGCITKLQADAIRQNIQGLIAKKETLRSLAGQRFSASQSNNWKNEAERLSTKWATKF